MKFIKSILFFQNKINCQRGMIAVDYLFAFVIAMGLFLAVFSLSFTLTMTEVAQYVAYSSARAFSAAHKDPQAQEALARNKFNELKKNHVLSPLFTNGWFELGIESIKSGGESGASSYSDEYPNRGDNGELRTPSVGIRLFFTSKILNFRNPLLGNAQGENEEGFKAKVTGLMKREPTAEECLNQIKRDVRYRQILQLDSRYSVLGAPSQLKYIYVEDNGC